MGALIQTIVVFAGLTGLILFFAGEVSTFEVIAALLCAAAGTSLAIALRRVAKKRFVVSFAPRILWKPLAALIPEYVAVGRQLLDVAFRGTSRQRGDFTHQPFEFGGDDATSNTRRALTVLGVSLAPRTFVVRGETDASLLLHSLPPKPPSSDTRWPA